MTSIRIPVKPYSAKYLNQVFSHCFRLTKRNSIGVLLFYLLHRNNERKEYDEYMSHYSAHVNVTISDGYSFKYGARELSSFCIVHFNTFVEDQFKREFFTYVEISLDYGTTLKDSIESFMKKYNLTDADITFDTLKKSYQRYTTRKEKKELPVLSLSL